MTKRLVPAVLSLGIVLAIVGGWWVWTGLDIVQVERGWSGVIAGATILSAGLVIVVLSAVLATLRQIAERLSGAPAPAVDAGTSQSTPVRAPPVPGASFDSLTGDKQIVGRHVSGDATYLMFADGTVEAQTPDGVLKFESLDSLRAYADQRERVGG